jgi:hypothetical protein
VLIREIRIQTKEIMQKVLLLIVLLFVVNSCQAQTIGIKKEEPKIKLVLNFNVFGQTEEEKEIIRLWEELLNKDFRIPNSENLKYWIRSEQFNAPNVFMSILHSVKSYKSTQATVIALMPLGKDSFMLKTMFSTRSDSLKRTLLEYIYTVHVVKTDKGYKFLSLPQWYFQNWEKKKMGSITYSYDKSHPFDEKLAIRLDSFNRAMSQLFKSDIQSPLYFVGKNAFEAYQIMGYDFSPEQATITQYGAITNLDNKTIFAGNGTEYYPHEIVHFYTHQFWGKDDLYYHQWFDEGIAALFGGYLGQPLEYYWKEMKMWLDKHPEEPLNDISTFYFNVSESHNTNFMYEIGGLICKKVYEKDGMNGLFDLLKSGNTDEDFYKAVEKHFGVKKENFGTFIRNELKNY